MTDVAAVGLNFTFKVALCPGVNVIGVLTPLTASPCPLTLICEIVVELFPVLVTVTDWLAELPTLTFPKLKEVGPTPSVVVLATPDPLTATVAGEFGALLATLMLPLVLPALCGAYSTLKLLLCPTAIVNGVATPFTLTPDPVEPNCVTVRLAVPVFVIVTGCDFDWPSTKLPKLMLAGETLIPGCTPVPDSATPGAAPGASLVIPTVPPTIPVAVGANVTGSCADCPAAKVAGVAKPASLKPVPEANTCEMCTAA